jgi:hypothetical protein
VGSSYETGTLTVAHPNSRVSARSGGMWVRAAFIEAGQAPNAWGAAALEQPLAQRAMPRSTAALAVATLRA